MGSIDLRDAYYSVRMAEGARKYLKFRWNGQLYRFVGMPNGLSSGPRVFTKILTPVFAQLREQGHECFPYIDDSFVVADTEEECRESLQVLVRALDNLGFVIHQEKSQFVPSTNLTFLGFELDSLSMTVSLTQDKKEKFLRASQELLSRELVSIREVAGLVGLMVSYSPAVQYGGAHIRSLELLKNQALGRCRGNFEGLLSLSEAAREDIHWWIGHLGDVREVDLESPDFEIFTDASHLGWGAHKGDQTAGGRWTDLEAEEHINVLELKAILFGLKSLCSEREVHVRVMTDNTTALAYVKHMGGVKSPACNKIAKEIRVWAEKNRVWITITHVPGVCNVLADFKSRNFVDNTEWELNPKVFSRVCKIFGTPEVDLFASRLTKKVDKFVSWDPDPESWRVDAFTFKWTQYLYFVFPPFSLVGRVLQKLLADATAAILVVPWWSAQPWFGRLMRVTRRKIYLRRRKDNLLNKGRPTNRDTLHDCPLIICRL